ncbi:MAG: Excinuclease ABC C subunit domain protein [candidate division TM6 bacterium GW2011_GWF2_32_72]|nr:MAG: Excinuclease ABC C subunit domain protein [candidate division TM6 bacterium GW2011_GWF2_32_72]
MKLENYKSIPAIAGVYIFKDLNGVPIYIGKAKNLLKRVSSYFQKRGKDWKIELLFEQAVQIDYVATHTEMEALMLEAQLVKEHQPKLNVLLKEGQPFLYILFTEEDLPKIKLVRNKQAVGKYFGPFINKGATRQVFKFLEETFKLRLCNKQIENGCLEFHIGICAGNCMKNFDTENYLFRLELAQTVLKSNHEKFLKSLKEKIKEYNQKLEFEKSKNLAEYLHNLDQIFETIRLKFSEDKFDFDVFLATSNSAKELFNSGEQVNKELQQLFELDFEPRSIDCFDISHFQGHHIVGSCIRFTDGKPEKNKFRKFKIKTLENQNDCAALQEIVARRYRDQQDLPDIVLIDGGKGQLSSVQHLLPNTIVASLAKREETLFSPNYPNGKILNMQNPAERLLIALRDYAHHFAVSYHRKLRSKIS